MDITKWTRREIREYLQNSPLRGLVPADFQVDGPIDISFIPTQKFWDAWRQKRGYMEDHGCRVYGPKWRKATKPSDWICHINMRVVKRR